MDKQELFKKIMEKASATQAELDAQYKTFEKECVERGIKPELLERYTMQRLQSFYKKQFRSTAEKFIGVFIGDQGVTDFGAKRAYDALIKQWDNSTGDQQLELISQGVFNEMGKPVYTGENVPAWKKGKPIIPEESLSRTLLVLCKKADDTGDFKLSTLTLRTEDVNKEVPMFREVEFRAVVTTRSTPEKFFLNFTTVTEFKDLGKSHDLKSITKQYFPGAACSLPGLNEWVTKQENTANRDKFVVIKGNVSRIQPMMSEQSRSNLIEIDDLDLGLEGDNPAVVSVWVPKSIKIDFDESTQDLFIIGRPSLRKDKMTDAQTLIFTAYGLWCPPEFRVKVNPITEPPKKTETATPW